jgi:hypothetical protein
MIEDLADGWIDVLAATSAVQVDNLFNIARDRGRHEQLRVGLAAPRLCVAAQGIVCASAFARLGVTVDVVPPRASMGALVIALARSLQPVTPPPPTSPARDAVVALLIARSANADNVGRVVSELPAGTTLAVLSGKNRRAERLAEDVAVRHGMAVHAIAPAGSGRHPADTLVRRADVVFVVSQHPDDPEVNTMLRRARRYAKPAQVKGRGRQV